MFDPFQSSKWTTPSTPRPFPPPPLHPPFQLPPCSQPKALRPTKFIQFGSSHDFRMPCGTGACHVDVWASLAKFPSASTSTPANGEIVGNWVGNFKTTHWTLSIMYHHFSRARTQSSAGHTTECPYSEKSIVDLWGLPVSEEKHSYISYPYQPTNIQHQAHHIVYSTNFKMSKTSLALRRLHVQCKSVQPSGPTGCPSCPTGCPSHLYHSIVLPSPSNARVLIWFLGKRRFLECW